MRVSAPGRPGEHVTFSLNTRRRISLAGIVLVAVGTVTGAHATTHPHPAAASPAPVLAGVDRTRGELLDLAQRGAAADQAARELAAEQAAARAEALREQQARDAAAAAAARASRAAQRTTPPARPAHKAPPAKPHRGTPPVHASGSAARVVSFALAQVGKRYVSNAAGPNAYDCSGLAMMAYRQVGISLPHYTGAMIHYGRAVSRSQLQPGDLVFWSGHVAIYIGGGQIVAAATPAKGVVRESIYGSPIAYRRLL